MRGFDLNNWSVFFGADGAELLGTVGLETDGCGFPEKLYDFWSGLAVVFWAVANGRLADRLGFGSVCGSRIFLALRTGACTDDCAGTVWTAAAGLFTEVGSDRLIAAGRSPGSLSSRDEGASLVGLEASGGVACRCSFGHFFGPTDVLFIPRSSLRERDDCDDGTADRTGTLFGCDDCDCNCDFDGDAWLAFLVVSNKGVRSVSVFSILSPT